MRILHILDHSLPLQSGYVYRTLGIINQQRALGWEPVLLTSGKHYAPGPTRERIGGWEFLRTPMPTGFAARLPWLRELKIVSDLDRRLDDVIGEVRPEILHAHSPALNALSAIRAGRRHRVPVVYEMRSLWEDAAGSGATQGRAGLRYRATKLLETHALRRADAVTTICQGLREDMTARGIPKEKITIIPNAIDRDAFAGPRAISPTPRVTSARRALRFPCACHTGRCRTLAEPLRGKPHQRRNTTRGTTLTRTRRASLPDHAAGHAAGRHRW